MASMDRVTTSTPLRPYTARLRGGPDDGALVRVVPAPGGAPPDFFHAGPDDPGIYVLAGACREDGSLPYWFVPSLPRAEEPAVPVQPTVTLVSMAGEPGLPVVWHQHGEGTSLVRLRAVGALSQPVPSFVGRTYVCPRCEETTIISLPGE